MLIVKVAVWLSW